MITKELLIEIGATLNVAEITDAKFDSCGYGEVTLETTAPFFASFSFSVSPDCEVRLFSCEVENIKLDREEIAALNRDIEWENILNSELFRKISEKWNEGAAGPYYDFYFEEYETEEEEVYA